MGREVKRVPLNFQWPIGKIWPFYLLSTCIDDCEECKSAAKILNLEMTDYGCPAFCNYDPPTGDGYQLWETTTEGSPMSPVFSSPEELAEWLEANEASSFADMTCNYDEWLSFIRGPGWAPSAIVSKDGFKSGVCASVEQSSKREEN